jgi:hypothetical protein
MNREFQAVYRLRSGADGAFGEPRAFNMIAVGADQVRAALNSSDCHVVSVTELRAVVDWDKPVWDLDEFAAAMSIKGTTLSSKKGDGKIPWSSAIGGVPRDVAMRWIEDSLNEDGKRVVAEIRTEPNKTTKVFGTRARAEVGA